MSCRTVAQVAVKAIEKRGKSDVFALQVTWSDGSRYVIYRPFTDIASIHAKLVKAFPIEAGKIDTREKKLPDLPRKDQRSTPQKAMASLALYFVTLLNLDHKIITYPDLESLLTLTPADIALPKTQVQPSPGSGFTSYVQEDRTEDSKINACEEIEVISGPMVLETYIAAAAYKSKGKNEVSFSVGDDISVIDKDPRGWWFVRSGEQEGWAPSTYLQPLNECSEEEDCTSLMGETFLATKAYTAQQEDELSFPCNASIEIRKKSKDGWWVGSFDGKRGYVPAAYLLEYSNPHLRRRLSRANSECPGVPVERSNTLKLLKVGHAQSKEIK